MTTKTQPNTRLAASLHLISRPYTGIEMLSDALTMCQLVVPEGRFEPGQVSLPPESLPLSEASLEVYLDVAGVRDLLNAIDVPTSAVSLAVLGYGNVVADSALLADVALDDLDSPLVVTLTGADLILQSPNGFDVRAFLYLSKPLKARAFRPSVPGTWFAHAEFKVGPYSTLSRFCPTPLDDQMRGHYGLPRDCMTYVRIGDGVLEAESLEEEVDVFVDVNVLRLLQENPSDPLSMYMQLELVILTLVSVITKVASQAQDASGPYAYSNVEDLDTPAMQLAQAIAASTHTSTASLMAMASSDPGMLRSVVEGYVRALKTSSAALREIS